MAHYGAQLYFSLVIRVLKNKIRLLFVITETQKTINFYNKRKIFIYWNQSCRKIGLDLPGKFISPYNNIPLHIVFIRDT